MVRFDAGLKQWHLRRAFSLLAGLLVMGALLAGCSSMPPLAVTRAPTTPTPVPTIPPIIIVKLRPSVTPRPTRPPLVVTIAPPTPTPLPATPTPLAPEPTPTEVPPEPTPTQVVAKPTPTPTPTPTATSILAGVSLEEKIGQMLMTGFRGLTVDENSLVVQDIRERNLGGVILFDFPRGSPSRNIESPEQLQKLTAALQAVSDTPLLIAVDHEGGFITRLKEEYGFPATVSHQVLGQQDDLERTTAAATQMAETLAAAGINLNLAPVVDLNVNPANPVIGQLQRSFSDDPDVVTRHALAFIEAHHEQGVLTTLKHFPGHGSAGNTARLAMFDVTATWSEAELQPFAAIIEAGQADAIMVAHIFNTNLDPDYPASLSRAIVTGVLRDQLGYDGVVISDDILAGPILENYGLETAIQAALEAGVDIITATTDELEDQLFVPRAVEIITQLVEDGTISEERIDQSYLRIQRLKSRLAAASEEGS